MEHASPQLWDIFCRVIDNYGDIGVCWRLATGLATRGQRVRLWVDDASALDWMAPGALAQARAHIQVLRWTQSCDTDFLRRQPAAQVWIEAFGCEIAIEFVATYADSIMTRGPSSVHNWPKWLNLEYLSAEAYVARSHALPSPVMSGPAQGQVKHFFYPGFTVETGGLLREPDLVQRQAAFDRSAWLTRLGIPWVGEQLVSLFCYEPAALGELLAQLACADQASRLLVTPGRASAAVHAAIANRNDLQPSWNKRNKLSISYLCALSQHDYDHLLWACDLNFVRGEDSLVRALWAARPFVWHIYPQEDDAHHVKLEALLDAVQAPPSWRAFHRVWNGLSQEPLPTLTLNEWQAAVQAAHAALCRQEDLVSQLIRFVAESR